MRLHALKARPRRRRQPIGSGVRRTAAIHPNTLDRQFTADAPNRKWAADLTYIRTAEGWLYVAVVLDLYSRRVVGRSMSSNIQAERVKRRQPHLAPLSTQALTALKNLAPLTRKSGRMFPGKGPEGVASNIRGLIAICAPLREGATVT